MAAQDTSFARLVSLACHDLRTPLATVFGFARTLTRAVAERLGPERVLVSGGGTSVRIDVQAIERAVSALTQCALRHGGLEEVSVAVENGSVLIAPITPASAPVVLGEDLRDLGAAVAVRAIEANGGRVSLEGDKLTVSLPG
jgi:signal transduction histidine kinase